VTANEVPITAALELTVNFFMSNVLFDDVERI
jgi:hypothetical protein